MDTRSDFVGSCAFCELARLPGQVSMTEVVKEGALYSNNLFLSRRLTLEPPYSLHSFLHACESNRLAVEPEPSKFHRA